MAAMAVLMMGVTTVDVVLRWFGSGIPGAYEIVALGMRLLIPLAFPYVFWTGANVSVELLTQRLPRTLQRGVIRLGLALSTVAMVYLTYAVILRALTVAEYGELTTDLALPQFYFWLPLIAGCALSIPVTLYLMFVPAPVKNSKPLVD
jgi:TRAP-type C4-dicarboxylate transport system permease small subunit